MIRAIIVDDEPYCCDTLETMLEKYCPGVELVAVCHSGEEAIAAIEQHQPDHRSDVPALCQPVRTPSPVVSAQTRHRFRGGVDHLNVPETTCRVRPLVLVLADRHVADRGRRSEA